VIRDADPPRWRRWLAKPHLLVVALLAVTVPRRLRADWRAEWEAELQSREQRLAQWQRLHWRQRWNLLGRSSSAFWDALWLQGQRREDEMVMDIRLGLRWLIKSPAFTAVAVLTLALGIGANTAVFTFVDALLLRPLPGVAQPDGLVQIGRQYPDKSYLSDSSYPDFLDYGTHNTVLSGLAAIMPASFHLRSEGGVQRVEGELVSGRYFDVLGTRASLGRLLGPADEQALVAVVSHRLWQQRFAGLPSTVGATVTLNGQPFTIVGVAGEGFAGIKIGTPRDVWIPLAAAPVIDPGLAARFLNRRASWLEMFGRVGADVTLERARGELAVIARRLEAAHPATNARVAVGVEPGLGRDVDVRRAMRRFVSVPFAAAALVLLITCANVAGLLLARSVRRRKELATRLALGASRGRVIRQLLVESLVLAFAGGLAGLLVSIWLTRTLRSLLPDRFLFLSFDVDLGADWRIFGFMLAVTLATAVACGLLPALQGTRPGLMPALKSGRLLAGRRETRWRSTLVVVQIALAVVLLVAAGLSVRSLRHAAAIDTGYQARSVLTARIDLAKQRYDEVRGRQLQEQLLERLDGLAGIQAASLAFTLPLNDTRWSESIRRADDTARVPTFQNAVSPRYFETMDIPFVAGRGFAGRDDEKGHPVAILNQTLARMLWPGEKAIGRYVTVEGRSTEVVGVVRDIKGRNLFKRPDPILYLPLSQSYHPNVVLHVRTAVPPLSLGAAIRQELARLDKDLPLYAVKSLDEHVTATLTPQRLLAFLIGGFGALAAALTAIGLYGLLSYTVGERAPEVGVRMALGARRADVVRLFMIAGLKLAVAGIVVGMAAALGAAPMMRDLLYGVDPIDPLTFLLAPVMLLGTALLAAALPARRAAAADAARALRAE
jgi:predicted permease